MNIESQLGLGYLKTRPQTSAGGSTSTDMPDPFQPKAAASVVPELPREWILTFGRPLLDDIGQAAGSARLWDLIDKRQMPIDVALRLVDAFEQDGLLEVMQRDLKGNHEVRLTAKGRTVIAG